MTAHTHNGSLLCTSLTRVRAMPVVDRGARFSTLHALPEVTDPKPLELDRAPVQAAFAAESLKRTSPRHRKTDAIEYRLIFSVLFVVFFVASVFERALPSKWQSVHGSPAVRKPLVEQAKEAASISAGYAFMG